MVITKEGIVFDDSKINVGDVVEIKRERSVMGSDEDNYVAGVVQEVRPDRIVVDTKRTMIPEVIIYAESAERVRIIHRSYYNVGKGEEYGAIDGGGRIYERTKK